MDATPQSVRSGMQRKNLLTLFEDFGRYHCDRAVVFQRGYRRERWTYRQLAGRATARALQLKKLGVSTGNRVLLWGTNSGEWVAAFWACLLRGAVAVPIDEGATPEFVARVMRDAGVKFAFADAGKPVPGGDVPVLRLEGLADSAATRDDFNRPRVRSAGESSSISPSGTELRTIPTLLADAPIERDTIAQILFTSGTTAEPRGVVLTHGNFLANLEPLEQGIREYDKYERWVHPLRFLSVVPLSHVFGQFMALFVPPLLGASVVFEPSASPPQLLRAARRERATALIAVPRLLDAIQAEIERDVEARGETKWFRKSYVEAKGRPFLSRAWRFRRIHRRLGWRFWAFISGGAALSTPTEEFLKRIGYAVVQGYGMTETASLVSLNHPFHATEGSVGKVLPGREFKLAEDGEILVRGNNVSAGYWEGGALRAAADGGWLRTGDLGEMDAEGNLRFRGRKKNVIVTPAGLNVYPEDLEAALKKQAAVRDAVVLPQEKSGNAEAVGVLLLTEAKEATARDAVDGANRSLAEYQRIREWVIWREPDFPRTATGKPRLGAIAAGVEALRGGELSSEAGLCRASPAPAGIAALLETIAGAAAAGGEPEKELNLSSLDRVELLSALEQKFHVELNEAAFANARSVADVQRLVAEPEAQQSEYAYPRWAQWEPVRWLRLLVYYMLVWPATQILGRPEVVGRERLGGVPGPLIVVSNHITRRADIGLILAALPARFRHRLATTIAGETLKRMRTPPREWFFAKRWGYSMGYWLVTALFNVFPLPRFSGFRDSFRFAGESVDRGYSVLVFPEGEVNNTETGEMAPFQPGIGLLAQNLGVPIVPMRLDGVWQMKREGRRLAHAGEIRIRIGTPLTFPAETAVAEIPRRLEEAVRSL